MAERIHLGADLADFGGDELVVPDRFALGAVSGPPVGPPGILSAYARPGAIGIRAS
jgi:hypothetical protein